MKKHRALWVIIIAVSYTHLDVYKRQVFPQLTEERRKDLTKQVRKYAEDSKVAVRNIRRDAVDYVKKAQKKGELTEDDQKKAEKDIQDLTDKHVKKIDEMLSLIHI